VTFLLQSRHRKPLDRLHAQPGGQLGQLRLWVAALHGQQAGGPGEVPRGCGESSQAGEGPADDRAERGAAQVELLETLLATLDVANDFEPSRSDRTRQAWSLIVKIAEDHALAQTDASLYVTDLCRVTGVSERTLEYAFKEVTGLTPMAYLMRLRLHRVRQALLPATPESTTVSAEALNWGFWHFGEFSRAYKDCFGELPSDTLRRKPEPPGGRQ